MPSKSSHTFNLRAWNQSDLDSLIQHADNPKIARFMTDGFPHPYTREAGEKFIAFATSKKPAFIFAIEVEGQAVGGIGLHPQEGIDRRNIELGYWLSEDHWGKGIISAAIRRMLDLAFEDPEIDRVFARPFGSNSASQHVLEKTGFKLEGRFEGTLIKDGQIEDELVYAMRRADWSRFKDT